jgi:hypothetical protein
MAAGDNICTQCLVDIPEHEVRYWRKEPRHDYERMCAECMTKIMTRNLHALMAKALDSANDPEPGFNVALLYPGWREEFARAIGRRAEGPPRRARDVEGEEATG